MNKKMLSERKGREVLDILKGLYSGAKSELNFSNPFELLIATILAAQCTDRRVNIITEPLFKVYKTPQDFLKLSEEELRQWTKSCNFYINKSKNILKTCKILVEKYGGKVPESREELLKLPGVGRKTANVVISNVFGQDAIPVDTHVFRVSNRIGLADGENAEITEKQLMKNIPSEMWSEAHHWFIYHGRRICKARRPACGQCPLTAYCLYYLSLTGK